MKSKERIEQEIDTLQSKIEEISQDKPTIHNDTVISGLKGYIKILKWGLES